MQELEWRSVQLLEVLKVLMVNFMPQMKINPMHLIGSYFSSVFTQEGPNTTPIFHIDKSDDVSLSSINITPSIVFDKLVSLQTGKSPGPDGSWMHG